MGRVRYISQVGHPGFTAGFFLRYGSLISGNNGTGRSLREAGRALAFGDYRLDIERRELRRGGEIVDLEPKAFDLLAYLVRHRDRVVSKDDLLQEVWGGRIVSEAALTTRINAVRRAVGDDGTAQRLVRTFTRKGIRFIGEVTELPDPVTRPPFARPTRCRCPTSPRSRCCRFRT